MKNRFSLFVIGQPVKFAVKLLFLFCSDAEMGSN